MSPYQLFALLIRFIWRFFMKNAFTFMPLLLLITTGSALAVGQAQPMPGGLTPQQQHEQQQQIQEQRKNIQQAHDKMMREMGARRLQETIDKK